ncbi:MAG: tetratricopeptide repeat protein [Capsulimonas sp.]|uniref:tetratricopeptide repeat protein n=1 Tax=Capsulimonas sp. TaxID=2494211 RepID=UPI003266D4E1
MSKRKRSPGARPVLGAPTALLRSVIPPAMFAAVLKMIEEEEWADAYLMLLEMEQRAPNDEMVLEMLVQTALSAMEFTAAERAALKLHRLKPRSEDALIALAMAHAACERPALALRGLEEIGERFPHLDTPESHEQVSIIRQMVIEILEHEGLRYPENLDFVLLHEESQMQMAHQDYLAARRTAQTLRARYPNFAPAVNNISVIYACEGEYEKAVGAAKEVLEIAPEEISALANLISFLCLLGRREEAASYVERMKSSKASDPARRLKMAEALTIFGDDGGGLNLQKQDPGPDESPEITAAVLHYAACAACRVDRRTTARRYWRQAQELNPDFPLIDENLSDLDLPPGERHGPVAFQLHQFLRPAAMDALIKATEEEDENPVPERQRSIYRKLLRQCPEIATFSPLILAHCDENTIQLFFVITQHADHPALLAAVKDFALGKRGSDALRMEALSIVRELDPGSAGPVKFWVRGEQKEIEHFGYEITDEPAPATISPEAHDLLEQGTGALREGRMEEAEQTLRRALELAPENHSIRNNLASALMAQGRSEEGREMLEEIFRRDPNYFFGRCNLAAMYAREGDVARARDLIEPLLPQRKLHVTELVALCGAQLEIAFQEDDLTGAAKLLDMVEQVSPGHPMLKHRDRLFSKTLLKSLEQLISKPKRTRRKKQD